MRALKYLTAFQIPLVVYVSLSMSGMWSFLTLVHVYAAIPLIDQLLPSTEGNMSAVEEETARHERAYDWLLYALVPVQLALLGYYLHLVVDTALSPIELVGNTLAMGISSAVLGINLAHELGHRVSKWDRALAKILLLSSLYTHFIIEHNLGHHRRVATAEDPATSRYGQTVYGFVPRSIWLGYLSAWEIERNRRRKKLKPFWSLSNEMIQLTVLEILAVAAVFGYGGWVALAAFLATSLLGQAQLEIINYIEHYGLRRTRLENGRYERVHGHHSWNSNHAFGRLVLFELTRHSDHHYMGSRPYQVLRHMDNAPQLPAGYPAMILLSLVPPAWFRIMNPRVRETMMEHYGESGAVQT